MLSKRAIVVSADKPFAKRLAAGLLAAGTTVETVASPEELPAGTLRAELVVVHLDAAGKIAPYPPRLAAGAALIAVIPTPSLELTVELLELPAVAGVLAAASYQPPQLSAIASRLLYGDVFGLEKLVPWGVKVYSLLVGDYQEKSVAISTVAEFAEAMGVRRKYLEAIEQCLDELLMNALYDAPVDEEGRAIFAEVDPHERTKMRTPRPVSIRYAATDDMFAIAVRDRFGRLAKNTILAYIEKCIKSPNQIDRKTYGAGLGLYLVANAAATYVVNVAYGIATEVVCTFDRGAKTPLRLVGVFVHPGGAEMLKQGPTPESVDTEIQRG
jgi:hypothetical protein